MPVITVGQLTPDSVDAPVAAHYGDPMREQRTAMAGVALVDRSHRGVLKLTGPERLSFLHNISSQYLLELPSGLATQTLLLSPHGHIEHHLWLTSQGDVLWVDVEPGQLAAVKGFLERMRFFTQVEIEVAELQVHSLIGPGAAELAGLGEPSILAVPGPKFPTGSVEMRPTSLYPVLELAGGGLARGTGEMGVDLLLPPGAEAFDVPLAGLWAYEALRVAARVPRVGLDTDHRTLPSEVDLIEVAVHLEKGCYRGQETVARVHHLGRPPRGLRLLHLDGISSDELPAPGTPVLSGERQVGFIGTAVRHAELGQVALGIVKRNISADTPLVAGESAVAVDPD